MSTAVSTASPADNVPAEAVRYICGCSVCAGAGASLAQQDGASPAGASALAASTPPPGDAGVAATLLAGSRWAGADANGKTVITYSFIGSGSTFSAASGPYLASASGLSEADRATTRKVLSNIEAVCGVTFVEVADSGDAHGVLRYGYSQRPNDMGYAGYAYYPSPAEIGGDIWIGSAQAAAEWDHYRPGLILHETLHALGLKHPFDGGLVLAPQDDIIPNTVMSYSAVAGSRSGAMSRYPDEPMPLDIQALQLLYGAVDSNPGDTVYDLSGSAFQANFHVVLDSGGKDTLNASRVENAVSLDLTPGASSAVGLTVHAFSYNGAGASRTVGYSTYEDTLKVAAGTWIENAVGSTHADRLAGNALANMLAGGAGDDALSGGGGDDMLNGGTGMDTAFYAGRARDFNIEAYADGFRVTDRTGKEGTDLLVGVESLQFADGGLQLHGDSQGMAANRPLATLIDLYSHSFNRLPAADDLSFWLAQYGAGKSLSAIGDTFRQMESAGNADNCGSVVFTVMELAHTFAGRSAHGFMADLLGGATQAARALAGAGALPQDAVDLAGSDTPVLVIGAAFVPEQHMV